MSPRLAQSQYDHSAGMCYATAKEVLWMHCTILVIILEVTKSTTQTTTMHCFVVLRWLSLNHHQMTTMKKNTLPTSCSLWTKRFLLLHVLRTSQDVGTSCSKCLHMNRSTLSVMVLTYKPVVWSTGTRHKTRRTILPQCSLSPKAVTTNSVMSKPSCRMTPND